MNEEEDFSPLIAMTAAILVLGLMYISILCLDMLLSNGYFQNWPWCSKSLPKRTGIEDDRPSASRRQGVCSGAERVTEGVLPSTGIWSGFIVTNNAIYEPWTEEYKKVQQCSSSTSDQELLGHKQVVMCEVHESNKGDSPFINDSIVSLSSSDDERGVYKAVMNTGEERQVKTSEQDKDIPVGLSQLTMLNESGTPSCKIKLTEEATWKAIINDDELGNVGDKDVLPLTEDTMYVRMSSSCQAPRPRIKSAQEIRPVYRKPRFLSEGSSIFRMRGSGDSSGQYIEMSSDCTSTISSVRTNEAENGSWTGSKTLDPILFDASITPCKGGRRGTASPYVNASSDSESNLSSSTKSDSGQTADSWSWALTPDVRPVSTATASTDGGSELFLMKSLTLIDEWFDSESLMTRKSGSPKPNDDYESTSGQGGFLQEVYTRKPTLPEARDQSLFSVDPFGQNLSVAGGQSLSVTEATGQELSLPNVTRRDLYVPEVRGHDLPNVSKDDLSDSEINEQCL